MGTGSAGSFADRGFAARMDVEAHTIVGIDWLGTVHIGTRLALVQLEGTPHFSLSTYQLYFLSRASMLYSISHRVLLIYKIYKNKFVGVLTNFCKYTHSSSWWPLDWNI